MTEETTKKIEDLASDIEDAKAHAKIMQQHTYFGLLLSTSAQVMHPGETCKRTVECAITLIDLCAEKAGIALEEIKP